MPNLLPRLYACLTTALKTATRAAIISTRVNSVLEQFAILAWKSLCAPFDLKRRKQLLLYGALTTELALGTARQVDANALLGIVPDDAVAPKKRALEWLPPTVWLEIVYTAATVDYVKEIMDHLPKNDAAWRAWYEAATPEATLLPEPFESKLSPLAKLVVVKIMRPERLLPASLQYSSTALSVPTASIARSLLLVRITSVFWICF